MITVNLEYSKGLMMEFNFDCDQRQLISLLTLPMNYLHNKY